ncbi:uncharacterized protein LOC133186364 [Saccostrea echinata]|uniref:uncharacterized protein LOC133186364 n=1 Tax=Saccostrea echinata TaxID=191078 RepID=UPI002A825392|nr:uncharacterized protein LOC133186364 [Saccostrea echinata]
MRLFQAQVSMEDFEPPPPFLKDPTRDNLKHITQFRDGRHRVATPEKVAIMELSTSFEKRRLGKQQQILTEMNQRCREQEVADLSSKLTNKCVLESERGAVGRSREITYYSTTFMMQKPKIGTEDAESTIKADSPATTPLPFFEKTYKHFPARKIIKHQGKFELVPKNSRGSPIRTPRIDPSPVKALVSQAMSDPYQKLKLLHSQRINGPVQLNHYINPKQDQLAPLVLPSIDTSVQEKIDAFCTSRVHLGTRSKTTGVESQMNGTLSSKLSQKSVKRTSPPKGVPDSHMTTEYQADDNPGGGNTPPPNSTEPPIEVSAV